MLLLNFGHPLTDEQLVHIREIAGRDIDRVIRIPTHLDHAQAFEEQVRELIKSVPLTSDQWQTTPFILNLPSLAPIVAIMLAEIHGLCGYFPTIIRLRLKAKSIPPEYEICELLNLQSIRDNARAMR